MARPTENNPDGAQVKYKKTPETIGKLEQAFALDCSIREACLYASINPDTYFEWVKDDKELSERFELLRETAVLAARHTVVQAIKGTKNKFGGWAEKPNAELALKYLERKKKDEFSLRTETENTNNNTSTVRVIMPSLDDLENDTDE